MIDEADRYNAELVLIEDKGSGTSLLQELSASGFGKGRGINPVSDKITRFAGITAMIEEGRVYLPHSAAWLEDFLGELCGFPGLKHDDQVDSTSQALAWFREEGDPGALWHFYRHKFEKKIAYHEHRNVQLRAPVGISHFICRDGTKLTVGQDRTIWLTEEDAGPATLAGFVRISK